MAGRKKINQYDVIEVIDVPEKLRGVIEIGDIGTVVEKYDDRNFEVECILPGGGTKWLATLPIKYIRLKTKDPYDRWIKTSLLKPMMQKIILFGAVLGAIAGGLIGPASVPSPSLSRRSSLGWASDRYRVWSQAL